MGNTTHGSQIRIFPEQRIAKSVRRGHWFMSFSGLVIGAGAILATAGLYTYWNQERSKASSRGFVYFEIKAIDEEGAPVAGADVAIGQSVVGTTDSFGEWRQFLRFARGSNIALTLSKTTGESQTLKTTKNLVVPMSVASQGDVEIKQHITLFANAATSKNPAKTSKVEQSEVFVASVSDVKMNTIHIQKLKMSQQSAEAKKLVNLEKLERLLYSRLAALGISEDAESPWALELDVVPGSQSKDQVIVVTSVQKGGESAPVSFLRNPLSDLNLLADQIVSLLRLHVSRQYQVMHDENSWYVLQPKGSEAFWRLTPNDKLVAVDGALLGLLPATKIANYERLQLVSQADPCSSQIDEAGRCYLPRANISQVAPRPELSRQKMRFIGENKGTLFVWGFAAQPIANSDGMYDVWAKAGSAANITLIEKGKITMRSNALVQDGSVFTVAKPAHSIARR